MQNAMSLEDRFNEHLNKELRLLPATKEKDDLKAELLDNLLSRAVDLKEKGISDDEIFKICIDSLGDYSAMKRALALNPLVVIKDKKFYRNMLYAMAFTLIAVIIQVSISYFTGRWGLTSAIVYPALFAGLVTAFAVSALRKNVALKSPAAAGIAIFGLSTLVTLGLFFVFSFAIKGNAWFSPAKAWSVLAFIPVFGTASPIITALIFKKKVHIGLYASLIITFSVALYLTLATILNAFHPLWLIILGGVCASIFMFIININKKMKN